MTAHLLPAFFVFLRILAYCGLTFVVAEVLRLDDYSADPSSEQSWTERTQLVMLSISLGLCLYARFKMRAYRHSSLLLVAFLGASLIRELDATLDRYAFDGCWQLLAFSLIGTAIFFTWRNRWAFLEELAGYLPSRACGLFIAGLLTTYVFSRFFGRRIFWEAVMGDAYSKRVKSTAEESLELFGYTVILISAIELLLLRASPPPCSPRETGPRQADELGHAATRRLSL